MGVRYPFRKQLNFDGLSTPNDTAQQIKKLCVEKEVILEYEKPHLLYLQIKPLKKVFVSTVTIAAKHEEKIYEIEGQLIDLLKAQGCSLFNDYGTVHTYKEDGIWKRRSV